jgi:hypothetical protein
MIMTSENAASSHPSTETNDPSPVPVPDPATSAFSTVRMIDPYEPRSEKVVGTTISR